MASTPSRWPTPIRLTSTLAAATMASALLVAPAVRADAATASSRPRPPVPHLSATAAALARARATGRPVVVEPDTTKTSLTVANPDGTLTNTVSALPTRVRVGGAWVPVSARLVRATGAGGGVLRTAAAAEPVTLSAGGAGGAGGPGGTGGTGGPSASPLVTLHGPAGQALSLWLPGPGRLPKPVVRGATATYRSVRPGIDLRLTATTTGGIIQALVVHTAAAAAAAGPWLRHFTERYATAGGLTLRADRTGNLVATGRNGPVFGAAPPAVFLPPSTGPSGHPGHPGHPGASAPGQPVAVGRATASGGHITDLIDPRALARRARGASGPLTVAVAIAPVSSSGASARLATRRRGTGGTRGTAGPDAFPSPNTLKPTGYVEAQDVQGSGGCQTDKNWNSTTVTNLGIGFQAWASCIGVYQSYYVFDTSGISNSWDILHMELNLTETQGSWDACGGAAGVTKEPVYLHSLGASAGIGSGTDGSNVSTLGTSSMVDQVWPAANPNTTDNCAAQPADFNITSLAGSINGSSAWTFGVSGDDTDNTSAGQFMRLSDNPTLVTTFDEFPAAPTMQQSAPAEVDNPAKTDTNLGCASSSNANPEVPWIGAAASVQLNANYTAPLTGEEVEPGWKVWNSAATLVNTTNANTSAGVFPFSFATPTDGDEYFSQIWTTVNGNGGQGGLDPGETTQGPECSFAVDATPPSVPSVTSTDFPPAGSTPGTTQLAPGASGTFSFSAADPAPSGCTASNPIASAGIKGTLATCLASGTYEFEYSLNEPLSSGGVTPITTTCPTSGAVTSGAVAAVNPTGNPTSSPTANPSAATTATSCPIPVNQWGTNILYVAAVDTAGNISQTFQYEFYVPWNPATPVQAGDINGDGEPDLLTSDSSGNLVFFPAGTDPKNGPLTASLAADAPEFSSFGDDWSRFIFTNRGSWSAGSVDDLLALDTSAGNLYRYNNSHSVTGMFENPANVVNEFYPACAAIPSGEGGAGSSNCTGYPTAGWGAFTQIIAPGDAWAGAPSGSSVTSDTAKPSLLAVDGNGRLWLFQGSGGQLTNPVQLGSTGWNNVTVMAAGQVDNVNTIWARVNAGTDAGDIVSFPLTVPSGQVPTLNAAAPATLPAPTSGTILVNGSGSAIQVPVAAFPAVTATGPLSSSPCPTSTGDDRGCPGFFARDTSGDMFYFPGQPTTTAANALSGTSQLVGDVGGNGQDDGTIPTTGTVQLPSNPGDFCKLTNVTNQGGGWRINADGTVAGFYLNEGASLGLGSQVECWFANGMHEKLVLQGSDGNLVQYQYFTPQTWGAGTGGKSASVANFQTDGNFVVRSTSGTALWASGTHTYHDAVLVIQADGNVVIYASPSVTSAALWSTGTSDPSLR